MPLKPLGIDLDQLAKDYASGISESALAKLHGVNRNAIRRRLLKLGVVRRDASTANRAQWATRRHNLVGVTDAYVTGTSEKALAEQHGVSRQVIRRHLVEAGITIRTKSAAEQVKWSKMTTAQRTLQVVAAHDATRGVARGPRPAPHAHALAKAKEIGLSHVHPTETEIYTAMLGVSPIQQLAIGPYNADVAAQPVAVEVCGSTWKVAADYRARLLKRTRHILDAGWHVVFVTFTRATPFMPSVIGNELIAYVQLARDAPSMTREYRVIRGNGEWRQSGHVEDIDAALVPALRDGFRTLS